MDLTLKIESLAYNGYGIGKSDSKIIFVDYAVPGDILEADVYDEHKNYAFAKIKKILNRSKDRIEPLCEYFGICGGCSYLNIPYELELFWKNEIFKSEFNRALKNNGYNLSSADYLFEDANINGETNRSEKNGNNNLFKTDYLNYRKKINLKVCPPQIGFYKKQSHNVVDVEYCLLASDEINAILKNIRVEFEENSQSANNNSNNSIKDNNDATRNILKNISSITLTNAGSIKNALFKLKDKYSSGYEDFFKDVAVKYGLSNIFAEYPDNKNNSKSRNSFHKKIYCNTYKYNNSNEQDYFTIKGIKFYYDLPSFIQINKNQNEKLIDTIISFLKNATEKQGCIFDAALDLFCGFGNITLFLSPFAKKIAGVDLQGYSIDLGRKNLKLNGIKNINFIASDTKDFLKKEVQRGARYDIAILDPPRAGIKGLVPYVVKLKPDFVMYVSCDPTTLIRDLKVFVENGYAIKQIKLIDMFPRTYHIESVTFLERKKVS